MTIIREPRQFGIKECIVLKKKLIAVLMSIVCIFALSACTTNDNTGTNNTTNTKTTNGGAIDEAGDVVDKVGDDAGNAVENVGDAAGDVVEGAGDVIDDAGDDASRAARNTMDDMKDDMSTTTHRNAY